MRTFFYQSAERKFVEVQKEAILGRIGKQPNRAYICAIPQYWLPVF